MFKFKWCYYFGYSSLLLKAFKFILQKFNPWIIIFPIYLPLISIIIISCFVGLLDNFLLLFFKLSKLPYEQYSSILQTITSFIPLGYGFIPAHLLIAYFFYPLQKKWLRNKKLKKISRSLIFLWWFVSGLVSSYLAFIYIINDYSFSFIMTAF